MIPIYSDQGEKFTDENGNVVFVKTEADEELREVKEPHITIAGQDIPVWLYIEMYCPIEDRNSRLTGFALNRSQIEEYKVMAKQYEEQGIIRLNIGKSRQMGGSTLISAMLWTIGVHNVGTKCGIIADTEDKGKGLLKKYKTFYENCPEPIGSMLRKCESVNNATELTFSFGKGRTTSFQVVVQGEDAGASKHFNLIHESEVALWENIAETLATLEQTVSDSDPRSIIVRETTARGHNHWETVYMQAKARKGTFRSVFVPWYWEPSYSAKYDGHPLTDYERKLVEVHGCTLEQVQFYSNKLGNMGGAKRMYSEFPTNETEMFMGSGLTAFDAEALAAVQTKEPLCRGRFRFGTKTSSTNGPIALTDVRWEAYEHGPIAVYSVVPVGHPLFVCCDPAKGGTDFWAAHIIDNSSFHSIAVYHEQGRDTRSDHAALQFLCLLVALQCGCFDKEGRFDPRLFSVQEAHRLRAGVTGERNTTEEFFDIAWRLGLRNIPRDGGKDGYRTGVDNRKPMLDLLDQMLRDTNYEAVSDPETIGELLSFQYEPFGRRGEEKLMAAQGHHDDLVMSLAGAAYMRSYFPTTIVETAKRSAPKVGFDPLAREEPRKKSKHEIIWR